MTVLRGNQERDLFSVRSRPSDHGSKKNKCKYFKKFNKKKFSPDDELEVEFLQSRKTKSGIELDSLTYETITEGQIILGCIAEVRQYELLLSLPHRMVGSVPITNISKAYKDLLTKLAEEKEVLEEIHSLEELFPVGHFLITCVKDISNMNDSKRTKVTLSVLPGDVNYGIRPSALTKGSLLQCAVQSVEDHGFVLDVGIPNVRSAFLPKDKVPKSLGVIGIGSVMLCHVHRLEFSEEEENKAVTIKVTAKTKHISQSPLEITSETNVSSLLPGTLIEAYVKKVSEEGLLLSAENLSGVVSDEHLTEATNSTSDYDIGEKVLARILYTANLTHTVHFTLNPSICSSSVIQNPWRGYSIGQIINRAKIIKIRRNGIYLSLSEDCYAFCSSSQLKDMPNMTLTKIQSQFPVGGVKPCRIVQYSMVDQVFIVSLKKSVLSEQVLGKMKLAVGQVLEVTVKEHHEKGTVVALSETVKGFVPRMHLTDSNMKHPEKKYPPGHTLRARILKYEPSARGPVLTLKSALVESKLNIVKNYDKTNVGAITEGCVAKVFVKGLLIELYGGLRGFIPVHKTTIQKSEDIADAYKEGQVVRCKIISLSEQEQKIMLSMKLKREGKDNEKKVNAKLKLGAVIDCKVKSVEEDNITVTFSNLKNTSALIPVTHLCDDLELCRSLKGTLQKGDRIRRAVIFSRDQSTVTLSLKPSIYQSVIQDTKLGINKTGKIEPGYIIPAVITELARNNLTISLMQGQSGQQRLLYKGNVVKDHIDDLQRSGLSVGQTVFVKCLKIAESNKALLSACLEDIKPEKDVSSLQFLYNHLMSVRLIHHSYENALGDKAKLAGVSVGDTFKARIEYMCNDGVLVNVLDIDLDGVVSQHHKDLSVSFITGNIINVTVLHVNYKYDCLELTTKRNIKKLFSSDEHKLTTGQQLSCEILLLKREFIMGRLKTGCLGQVVYLPAKRHINDFRSRRGYYEVGKKIKIVTRFINDTFVLADFHHHCKDNNKAVEIENELPEIIFKKQETNGKIDVLSKNVSSYTAHDFRQRARQKIEMVTQAIKMKTAEKKNQLNFKEKLKILKKDDFSQLDESYYWTSVLKDRKERKKLKKYGLKTDSVSRKKDCLELSRESQNKKRPLDSEDIKEFGAKKFKNQKSDEYVNFNKSKDQKDEDAEFDLAESKYHKDEDSDIDFSESEDQKDDDIEVDFSESEYQNEDIESNIIESDNKIDDPVPRSESNCLQLNSSGFVWEADTVEEPHNEESSSGEEEVIDKDRKKVKKLSKEEKQQKKIEEERLIRQLELQRKDSDRLPQSSFDYEELLQKNSTSSCAWVQYISFYLESAEADKARGVARRALQAIPATKEEDKLVIWNTLLRLEVLFGTPGSTEAAFKEAVVTNDELKIYEAMAAIFADANKMKEADDIYKKMTKKFSQNLDVWMKAGQFIYSSRRFIEARALLEKALLSLPKQDHVDVINRFAQFEFKYGDAERGRTMFESILSNFPKRIDIWNVYVDMLTKHNDIEGARNVLERMTSLNLRIKQMRTIYKKLLSFEKKHGTPHTIQAVKARVEEYVMAALKDES